MIQGELHEGRAVAEPELLLDVCAVGLGCSHADVEDGADLRARMPEGDEAQHLGLARGQAARRPRFRSVVERVPIGTRRLAPCHRSYGMNKIALSGLLQNVPTGTRGEG